MNHNHNRYSIWPRVIALWLGSLALRFLWRRQRPVLQHGVRALKGRIARMQKDS